MPAQTTPADFSPSQLAEFLRTRRDPILERWRLAVQDRPASQGLSLETLIDHIPNLLDAIADTGEEHVVDKRARLDTETAERHALERLADGFDLSQVVIELAVLRDCILQEWDRERAPGASRPEVRFLNRSVDRAIAASIDRYTLARDRTLKALDRISAAALEARRLDDLLQRLLEVMVETTASVDIGAILLRDGDDLILRAAVGLEAERRGQTAARIGEGFVGEVAAEGRPRLASRALLQAQGVGTLLRARGLTSAYGVPLVNESAVVGVAVIGSSSAPEFSDQDRRLFQAMVARATSGIVQHVLQESAETRAAELAAVIESIPDAVLVGDASGIRHANKATFSLLGVRSVEEVNRRMHGPDDIQVRRASTGEPILRGDRPFARALRGETVSEEVVLASPAANEDIVVRTVAAPVWLGGRVTGAVVVGTDVTEAKRAAKERDRLLQQAEQAVSDRDHVLAVVSHELRNPLNTITMAAAILGEMLPVSEAGKKSIATIARSAERMKRMIQDLLDLSSIQAGRLAIDPRPLALKSVVEEAIEVFESDAAERGLTLTVEVPDALPLIRADRDRLFQVLTNIVGNALKVTTAGGVTVGAEVANGGRELVCAVRDTGPGIPEDQQGKLFEPYWRGHSTYKGTGLGLAIARGVVEAHEGRIWVESTPGTGTTFFFTIPAAQCTVT